VQLDGVEVETEPRGCHVQAPDPSGTQSRFGDGLVPVILEVFAPVLESKCVVFAQVLLMPYLETGRVHCTHDVAGP